MFLSNAKRVFGVCLAAAMPKSVSDTNKDAFLTQQHRHYPQPVATSSRPGTVSKAAVNLNENSYEKCQFAVTQHSLSVSASARAQPPCVFTSINLNDDDYCANALYLIHYIVMRWSRANTWLQ